MEARAPSPVKQIDQPDGRGRPSLQLRSPGGVRNRDVRRHVQSRAPRHNAGDPPGRTSRSQRTETTGQSQRPGLIAVHAADRDAAANIAGERSNRPRSADLAPGVRQQVGLGPGPSRRADDAHHAGPQREPEQRSQAELRATRHTGAPVACGKLFHAARYSATPPLLPGKHEINHGLLG